MRTDSTELHIERLRRVLHAHREKFYLGYALGRWWPRGTFTESNSIGVSMRYFRRHHGENPRCREVACPRRGESSNIDPFPQRSRVHMRKSKAALAKILLLQFLASCGGEGEAVSSREDATAEVRGLTCADLRLLSVSVSSLSPSDLAQLCDCTVAVLGGYRKSVRCGDTSTSTPDDQAECVRTVSGCATPVSAIFDCAKARAPDLCAIPMECASTAGCR